ncbi:MAG: hypothetical protein R3336_04980 [Phycisphaeraceae bacterium]|nr:hypothetical protein [Phycisphaeraceae bacterium]
MRYLNLLHELARPAARWVLLLTLALSPAITAEETASEPTPEAEDSRLATERWSEQSHGISVRPPKNAELKPGGTTDIMVRMVTEDRWAIDLLLKKAKRNVDLPKVQQTAVRQIAIAHPSAVIVDEEIVDISGLDAARMYFRYTPRGGEPVVDAQAFVPVSRKTVAWLRARIPADDFEQARPLFEAVLSSFKVAEPEKLDEIRRDQIRRGAEWLGKIESDRLHAMLIPERWLRIVDTENNRDIGYMRIVESKDEHMGHEGIRILTQSRIVGGNIARDTIQEMFISNDGHHEVWSTRATMRPRHEKLGSPETRRRNTEASLAETGVRDRELITVTRETPSGVHKHHWQVPAVGYLPQVHAHLIGRLMAMQDPMTVTFYSYLPDKTKLTLRTYRLEKDRDGGYQVHFRLGPELAEQTDHRNGSGHLLRRDLGSGREIRPSTLRQIQQIWELD